METRRERTDERSDPLLSSEVDEPVRTGTRAVEVHPDRPVLHFLAQVVPINKFVISHEKHHPVEDEHPFTPHLKRQLFSESWIYDSAKYTIVGRLSVWIHGHRTMETRTQKAEPQSMSSYSSLAATERSHRRTFRREFSSSTYEFPSSGEYYDEMFDMYYYQPTKDWAAYIMLVGWKGYYAVRIPVGHIHAEAWLHVRRGSS